MSKFIKNLKKRVQQFKIFSDMNDLDDTHAVAAMHLVNTHKCDDDTAFNQTSHGANDAGIDAWFFSDIDKKLYIYQSKMSDNFEYVEAGIRDLERAFIWIEELYSKNNNSNTNLNHSNANFILKFSDIKDKIGGIEFILLSCLDEDNFTNSSSRISFEKKIKNSKLNKLINTRGGLINLSFEIFNLSNVLISGRQKYEVSKHESTVIKLPDETSLGIAYLPLYNLVELYSKMGDRLFNKNVRLTLIPYHESKTRVVNPMEKTFKDICSGKIAPEMFTFFHIGVTISTKNENKKYEDVYELEEPSVLNGCQTVTIAKRFWDKLIEEGNQDHLDKFKQIKVMAKIVVGASDDELREITNCNNRQNPIEEWQLFCNDEIHLKIEENFKDLGIFYERQKGRFDSMKSNLDLLRDYPNTNMTYVKIPEFAQLISIGRKEIQFAAKPLLIFSSYDEHNKIFDEELLKNHERYIFLLNCFRSIKYTYQKIIKEDESYQLDVFKKPIIKINIFFIGMNYLFNNIQKMDSTFQEKLHKKASPRLNEYSEIFIKKTLPKVKRMYLPYEKQGREVPSREREKFFKELAIDLKIRTSRLL